MLGIYLYIYQHLSINTTLHVNRPHLYRSTGFLEAVLHLVLKALIGKDESKGGGNAGHLLNK